MEPDSVYLTAPVPSEALTTRRFRKKPVVIEAWQWRGTPDLGVVPGWLATAIYLPSYPPAPGQVARLRDKLLVGTLEGVMEASAGDWIIRGVKGEMYPCKPDIFAATYEPEADERSAAPTGADTEPHGTNDMTSACAPGESADPHRASGVDKAMELAEELETAAILYGASEPESDEERDCRRRRRATREALRAHLIRRFESADPQSQGDTQ